jgi:hypothetical protein
MTQRGEKWLPKAGGREGYRKKMLIKRYKVPVKLVELVVVIS